MKTSLVPSIAITLKPSYWILGLYLTVSMFSVVSIGLAHLPVGATLAAAPLVIIATIYYVMRDVLLCLPYSWHQVLLSHHGKLTLINRSGVAFTPVLAASTVNHPWLTVLNFKRSTRLGWHGALMLSPSQVDDIDQFRRLRVWLKWSNYGATLEDEADEVDLAH